MTFEEYFKNLSNGDVSMWMEYFNFNPNKVYKLCKYESTSNYYIDYTDESGWYGSGLSDFCSKELQRRKYKKVNVEIMDDFI